MKRIAIVGSGIAGLTCAYHLCGEHDIRLFEANDTLGGHTHTVDVEWQGEKQAIDTGFIVFNDRTYPNFIRLLDRLQVAYRPTEMSFSVRNDAIGLEYNGHNLNRLFAQRRNLLSPSFWRLLRDVMHFNRNVRQTQPDPHMTVGSYLEQQGYGPLFRDNYLLPMIAAIWSMGPADSRHFPLDFFVRFFNNHGLLDLRNRPQWYSICGGSRSYLDPLTRTFSERIALSTPVRRIIPGEHQIRVLTDRDEAEFDEVILACHADQALALLDSPTPDEEQILGGLPFTENRVILHTDTRLLPRSRRAWASWNYLGGTSAGERATLTYNMNILQGLHSMQTFLVTLNQEVEERFVLRRFNYSHPAYTREALRAQAGWERISGQRHLHFCGAYWFNGFHEDGVRSALRVCESLGVTI